MSLNVPDPYSMGNKRQGSLYAAFKDLMERVAELEAMPPASQVTNIVNPAYDDTALKARIAVLEAGVTAPYVDPYVPCSNAVTCKSRVLPADMPAHLAWHAKLNGNNAAIKLLLPLLGYSPV